jgi:AAA-like domain
MAMNDFEATLKFTETLVYEKTGERLNDLQRVLLREVWQTTKKTYEQIAAEHNYSSNYVQQGVAPKLWRLLSQAMGQKVTKVNIQTVLTQQMMAHTAEQPAPQPVPQPVPERQTVQLASTSDKANLEHPGDSVPLNSLFYVQRSPYEPQCYQEVLYPGALIRIKAPKQMGKTSLMLRILSQATATHYQSVIINFQQAEQPILADLRKLLRWMSVNISRQLKQENKLEDYWDEEIGNKMSCTLYMEGHILDSISTPIVIALEEVSELFHYPQVAQEFFTMLRTWHEQTKSDETWKKLRLVMVYATEMYVPLHINQSPFNVGMEVALQRFDQAQVEDLAQRHELELTADQITQLMDLVTGHPYLVRLALYHLARQEMTLETLLETAHTDTGIYHHHLHRHLWNLQQYPDLETTFQQILCSTEPIQVNQMQGFKLQSMGLVSWQKNRVTVSCKLYHRYFRDRSSILHNSIPV